MENEVNVTPEVRQQAVDFLNSPTRNPETGLAILESANYKPHVCKIFRENISRKDIPNKIISELRLLLRYHAKPEDDIHKDVVPGDGDKKPEGGTAENTTNPDVVSGDGDKEPDGGADENPTNSDVVPGDGDKKPEVETDEDEKASDAILQKSNDEYPAEIKHLIEALSLLYKARSIEHKSLKAVGEGADDESNDRRAAIARRIINIGNHISQFGELFEDFTSGKEINLNELAVLLNTPVNLDEPVDEDQSDSDSNEKAFVLAETVEELKKQSDNWRTKVLKAENRLLYQSEKKLANEDPMPEGPKRIKQLKRIEKLKAEKLQIDTRLAELS